MEDDDIQLKKVIISFTRSPAKQGKYYVFSIPSSFIKEGLIDPNKTYKIYLEEIGEKDKK